LFWSESREDLYQTSRFLAAVYFVAVGYALMFVWGRKYIRVLLLDNSLLMAPSSSSDALENA